MPLPALAAIALIGCKATAPEITSFDDCVAARNPILESYPEQCRTPDGKNFVNERQKQPIEAEASAVFDDLKEGDVLEGTVMLTGSARGWYFEGSFPILLLNESGSTIAQAVAHAQGDWMTSDWVDFEATLNVPATRAVSGTLVARKSNPSGNPAMDEEVRIPVSIRGSAPTPEIGDEGGFCGGIAAFTCDEGLECELEGNWPDAGGICVKSAAE